MPNKQLTAKVRIDASQAHKSLDKLIAKIKQIEAVTNKPNGGGLEKKIEKALLQQERLKQATLKTQLAESKVTAQTHKTAEAATKVQIAEERLTAQKQKTALAAERTAKNTKATNTAQRNINRDLTTANSIYGSIWQKLKGIAATYLGIMGTRAVIDTTDLLVGAQNKLNYVNSQQLGDAGYNADGTYSNATLNATQESLDKMYASSQRVRTSYQDMMGNVSKTMMLAGGAFDNNIDNAIRFQEIMAEAYAVGGASAAEMSTSMYQLTQALGSGVLQGDELRSVREGAPLAYKAIEEFAQGVLKTDESLKELAADGKITSEMVVAAIMQEGKALDKAFSQTTQTFGQTLDQIKNTALYAFQPVMKMLTNDLTEAVESGLVEKFEMLFTNVAKAIMIAFKAIELGIKWISDNWYWLQYIVYGVITALIIYLGLLAKNAIKTAVVSFVSFLLNNPFIIWIMAIALLVAALVWLLNQCSNFCEFIIQLAYIVAYAILGVLTIVLIAYLATGTLMMSVPTLIALLIIGIIAVLLAAFLSFTGQIIGCVLGAWEVIKAVVEWINNGWNNMCNNLKAWFWNAIADMLEGVEWLLNGVNKIREALGKDPVDIGEIRAKAESYESKVIDNNLNIGSAWDTGYAKGKAIGESIQDTINSYGEKLKGFVNGEGGEKEKTSLLDEMGNKLGLDFSGMTTPFPAEGAGTGYEPDYEKILNSIDGNTGDMADSMELTKEDLEYLRRIADMEWKKEFTTAEIKVEMNNANTINGESDLDGIVTKLSDKLYEELNAVANGVYA